MSTKNPLKITITPPVAELRKHLNNKDNKRILLSGIFGIGKTYFLKEFFNENKDNYIPIYIYPVNYSVASNEDIFQLIKYDILTEIFGYSPNLEKTKVEFIEGYYFFLAGLNWSEFIENVLKVDNGILGDPKSKMIKDFISMMISFGKKVKKYKEGVEVDEFKILEKFEKDFKSKKGGIYESDFYTNLIIKFLNQIKQRQEGKETVLIIDDLDRIDPEHIFRIFNIFSTHSTTDEENKFGFDRVIISCDIKNIRNIFKNRYGKDVDFNGYVDKFYSRNIFHYNNTYEIFKEVIKILRRCIKNNTSGQYSVGVTDNKYSLFLEYLVESLLVSRVLNLRSLLKLKCEISNYRIFLFSKTMESVQIQLFSVFDVITELYESEFGALDALENSTLHSYFDHLSKSGEFLSTIFTDCLFICQPNIGGVGTERVILRYKEGVWSISYNINRVGLEAVYSTDPISTQWSDLKNSGQTFQLTSELLMAQIVLAYKVYMEARKGKD